MASKSGNMKGFYKQKKVSGGVGKSKAKPNNASSKNHAVAAALGSDVTQPAALISHGSPDLKAIFVSDDYYDDHEVLLRQFDMNMAYGPCLGMTRMARLERAHCLGLTPPKEIKCLLKSGKVQAECLWGGRI